MINVKKSPTLVIIALTLLFVVPFLAAWLAYSKGAFLSRHTVNHGVLLQPPLSIRELTLSDASGQTIDKPLRGKWSMVYLAPNPNEQTVSKTLYYLRQIRQATGKNRDRVERAIITLSQNHEFDTWLDTHFPGTTHFIITPEKMRQFESHLPKKLALQKGSLYLVDPLGNILLLYAPNAAPKGILKDLERVLKVSQIG